MTKVVAFTGGVFSGADVVPPTAGEAFELAAGVLWIRLPLPMALDHVNVYAFEDSDGWTLIDTGLDTRLARGIWAQLLAGPLAGRPVARLIVTHHHPDHIGLAGWFQAEHGAELITTRTAWLLARMLVLDVQPDLTPQSEAFYRAAGMDAAILASRRATRPFNFADVVTPLPTGFTRIREGSVLRFGGRDWDVRIGHGHAPEQATFWSRDDALVIGGDQLLATISPNIGVHVTEPDADPLGEWLESCARLGEFARDDHLVLPGHKLPFRGLPNRLRQMTDNHLAALDRLQVFLKQPQVAGGCFGPLFRRDIGSADYGLALAETLAHLNYLLARGRVTRTRRDDDAWLWQSI